MAVSPQQPAIYDEFPEDPQVEVAKPICASSVKPGPTRIRQEALQESTGGHPPAGLPEYDRPEVRSHLLCSLVLPEIAMFHIHFVSFLSVFRY